jgi:hypothetical protein
MNWYPQLTPVARHYDLITSLRHAFSGLREHVFDLVLLYPYPPVIEPTRGLHIYVTLIKDKLRLYM